MARMFAKNGMTIVGAGLFIALIFPLGSVYAQGNYNDFYLIFASDPQIGYCDPPQCKTDQDTLEQTKTWNQAHLSSIVKYSTVNLAKRPKDFLGLVMNGDLTNTGQDEQITYFNDTYMKNPNVKVYPGLGNHDYFSYIDVRCSVDGAPIPGGCFWNVMKSFVSWIGAIPDAKGFDWDGGFDSDSLKGSLDYYWDIGGFRFIQLNWTPAYTRDYAVYRWAWFKHQDFHITSGMEWLKGVLDNSSGMTVILNMHGINATDAFSPDNPDYAGSYPQFQKLLDQYPNIGAIFAGHIHNYAGNKAFYYDISYPESKKGKPDDERRRIWATNPNATPVLLANQFSLSTPCRNVPLFFSGSASYNLYLAANFQDTGASRSMAWTVIDSRNGDTKPVDSGQYQFPQYVAATPGAPGGCPTLRPTAPPFLQPVTPPGRACGEDCEIGRLLGEQACNKYLMRRPVPTVWLASGHAVMDAIQTGTRVIACQGAGDLDAAAMRVSCLSESFKNKVEPNQAAYDCRAGKGPQLRPTDKKPTWLAHISCGFWQRHKQLRPTDKKPTWPPPEPATWQQ